jgi:hypothetical protein
MTGIRQPGSGKPKAHQSGNPGKLEGLRRVSANPAATWMTWRLTAFEPSLAPRGVVWGGGGSRFDYSVLFVFGRLAGSAGFSGMFRLVVLHIRERMPVSRGSPDSQAPSPARRAAVRRSRG